MDIEDKDYFVHIPNSHNKEIKDKKLIVIGDKNKFAIEMRFDEFFKDDFIAYGSFRIYIKGFAYGHKEEYATLYGLIESHLREIIKNNIIVRNIFSNYSDYEIVYENLMSYQENEESAIEKTYLGMKNIELFKYMYSFGSMYESAFDGGYDILMFRDESKVKLLGYICPYVPKIENLNSITISREEFDNIIKESYKKINSERCKHLKQ